MEEVLHPPFFLFPEINKQKHKNHIEYESLKRYVRREMLS